LLKRPWDGATWYWPSPTRRNGATAAAGCLAAGALVALWRPGGRELPEWLFVLLHYLALPRRARWQPAAPRPADWRPAGGAFAGAAPRLRAPAPGEPPRNSGGGDTPGDEARHPGAGRASMEEGG